MNRLTNEEFLLQAKNRDLTDNELIKLFYNLIPESNKQAGIITNFMQKLVIELNSVNSIEEYLNDFTAEDFMDKHVKEAYSDYCQWCDLNNMEIQSNRLFTQSVQIYFNLKSKVIKSEGKSVRAYKSY